MQFTKKCPNNVIFIFNDMHNGNMKLEHFIDIGKDVPKIVLLKHLNAVNNQGITDIDLVTRTYKKGSVTLPIYKLSTGERIFLVASIATYLSTSVFYGRVMDQLSKPVIDRFLETFSDSNYVIIQDSVGYFKAREECLHV